MSTKINSVRGTQDLLPETSQSFRFIDQTALSLAQRFCYQEIDTPIFEMSEVFHRSLGETSDMVSKETYDFKDRGGDSLTLRPEGTAGVVRSLISNGLVQNLPLKYYYSGPMFRYERPQKGRFRQFHQFGVEALGYEHPDSDVESIALAQQILAKLGLMDKCRLELNTIGDLTSRQTHREKLVKYLADFQKDLSPDSQIRLQKNPLRIFDSKDPGDQKIIQQAPLLKDCLNDESKLFFDQVLKGLEQLNIPWMLNSKLVRGIDYYTHTVFEFTTDQLGAQGALLAGGRYNGLVEQFGGPATSAVGWASGMERISLLLDSNLLPKLEDTVAVIAADEAGEPYCLNVANDLRLATMKVENILSGNLGKKMKRANKIGAKYAFIIGSQEVANKIATVKNLETGAQKEVTLPLANLNLDKLFS